MKLSDIVPLFEYQTPESRALGQLINLSNKAFDQLSDEAKDAIREWELANWDVGKLVKGYESNSELIQEIKAAFAPIREQIRKYFGDTITLYRGQRNISKDQMSKNRQLYSFSFFEEIAKQFAHGKTINNIPSESEIDKAVEQFNRTGFVQFQGKKYKRSQEYPESFDIYDKRNDLVAAGFYSSELKDHLMSDRQNSIDFNKSKESKGNVHKIEVPIDKILWLTNNANSKEFIVALNPLGK